LYWSYFGVALGSILETSFTGFGRAARREKPDVRHEAP
jgi:hypothetical protein